MKLTEKGQVTIPLNIRKSLGLHHSSEVEFVLEGDHAVLRKIERADQVAEALSSYRGVANSGLSTEEILRLTRS